MSEKILQIKRLSLSFRTGSGKVRAVRDISFDLERGETLAIVGESGSGKSVTSKAILGISAINAIQESGEILYEDKDLLQIDEQDFHKIRGEEIAMVFQDPLSALNPIMRIGRQITEAMLRNTASERRNAKKELARFRRKLIELLAQVDSSPQEQRRVRELFRRYDEILKEEVAMLTAHGKAREHAVEARRLSLLMISELEKHQHQQLAKTMRRFDTQLKAAVNPYFFSQDQAAALSDKSAQALSEKQYDKLAEELKNADGVLERVLALESPDFFALAYCQSQEKDRPLPPKREEAESSARERLERGFLHAFRQDIARALDYSESLARESRKKAAAVMRQYGDSVSEKPFSAAKNRDALDKMSSAVEATINPLQIRKDSGVYNFRRGVFRLLQRYEEGIVKNRREEKRYRADQLKHERLEARGRKPDWKLIPPDLTDLEMVHETVIDHVKRMTVKMEEASQGQNSAPEAARALIRHFNNLAARMALRVSKAAAKDKAISLMREVGIPEAELRFKQYPFELSGGMRQRIVIAIALSANPDILICDEPTTALDVTIQSQILELINRIKEERGLSVIFITHDLGVVANMADRVAVMYAGKIVEIGSVDEVFYEPAHPYTWALLSSMPDLDTKEKLAAIPGTPPNMLMPPAGDAFAERNRYAMQIDFERQPPLFQISETHYAATWLLHPKAPKVEPPEIVLERIRRMKNREEAAHV